MKTLNETRDDYPESIYEVEDRVIGLMATLAELRGEEKRIHRTEIERLQAEVERWKEIAQR